MDLVGFGWIWHRLIQFSPVYHGTATRKPIDYNVPRCLVSLPEPKESNRNPETPSRTVPKIQNPSETTENLEPSGKEKTLRPSLPTAKQAVRLRQYNNRDREAVPLSTFFLIVVGSQRTFREARNGQYLTAKGFHLNFLEQ